MIRSQKEWEVFIDMMIVKCVDERVRHTFEESDWDNIATNGKLMELVRVSTEEGIIYALEYCNTYMMNHEAKK